MNQWWPSSITYICITRSKWDKSFQWKEFRIHNTYVYSESYRSEQIDNENTCVVTIYDSYDNDDEDDAYDDDDDGGGGGDEGRKRGGGGPWWWWAE